MSFKASMMSIASTMSSMPFRMHWTVRLKIAAGAGWLALHWTNDLSHPFVALGAALAAVGLTNAAAVASPAGSGDPPGAVPAASG